MTDAEIKHWKAYFQARVQVAASGCWEWQPALNGGGYGWMGFNGATGHLAHRASYEVHVGPIPEGKIVRHKCHNTTCVNPDHLAVGTHRENYQDSIEHKQKGLPK